MHQAITFSIQENNVVWFCSAIYASPVYSARYTRWDHLISIRGYILGPWVLLGDFNEIKSSRKVSGGSFSLARAHMLSNMMSGYYHMDLDTIGGFFTWRRNIQRGGHVIDRCLADFDLRIVFPHALVEVLPCHDHSDHNPL